MRRFFALLASMLVAACGSSPPAPGPAGQLAPPAIDLATCSLATEQVVDSVPYRRDAIAARGEPLFYAALGEHGEQLLASGPNDVSPRVIANEGAQALWVVGDDLLLANGAEIDRVPQAGGAPIFAAGIAADDMSGDRFAPSQYAFDGDTFIMMGGAATEDSPFEIVRAPLAGAPSVLLKSIAPFFSGSAEHPLVMDDRALYFTAGVHGTSFGSSQIVTLPKTGGIGATWFRDTLDQADVLAVDTGGVVASAGSGFGPVERLARDPNVAPQVLLDGVLTAQAILRDGVLYVLGDVHSGDGNGMRSVVIAVGADGTSRVVGCAPSDDWRATRLAVSDGAIFVRATRSARQGGIFRLPR